MEDDVTRAIKQLETIAIKAMKSGYLDDAAKVMHIAEEIERVDKTGIGAEALTDSEVELTEFASQEPHAEPKECQEDEPSSGLMGDPRFLRCSDAASEQSEQPEPTEAAQQQLNESSAGNVVPLNRFKMKRGAAVGDDMPESPLQ